MPRGASHHFDADFPNLVDSLSAGTRADGHMIRRRSVFSAVPRIAAGVLGLATSSSAPAVQSSGRRSLHAKLDEVASLADQLEINDFDDVAFAAKLAFARADTANGRGVSFRVPPRIMAMKAPLRVPDRVMLVGSGIRDSMFHSQHDGPMFIFRDAEHSGITNMRLGLGAKSGAQGVLIEANDRDIRRLNFADIEIAGRSRSDGVAAGQTGFALHARGRRIVSECAFDRIIFTEVDRPVVERGPEGNEWTRFVVDQFGFSGGAGFDSVGHANHYQGRIAGSLGAGPTAFRQGGYRNIILLRVDIGNAGQALDLNPEGRNIVLLQRPAEVGPPRVQTPIGRIAGNTVTDGGDL